MSGRMPYVNDDESWDETRRSLLHPEARAVLDAQNATMTDVDGKATKTVRFNAILIGLLLTSRRVTGPDVFHTGLLGLSLTALVCSTVVGIATYNESNLYVGPGGYFFEEFAREPPAGQRWDADLLEAYAGMIYENAETIDWNAWLLSVTQVTLVVGIVTAVLAAAI